VVEGVGSQIPYLGYSILPFGLEHVDGGELIYVPFLVNQEKMRSPIIWTNAMQEFMSGESSTEEKSQRLTSLQVTPCTTSQVDITADDSLYRKLL